MVVPARFLAARVRERAYDRYICGSISEISSQYFLQLLETFVR